MPMLRNLAIALTTALALAAAASDVGAQQRKTVKVGDMTVSYGDEGQGVPLVLVHGGGVNHSSWRTFLPEAVKSFRVLTPDTRDHGATDNPSGKFSYDLAADDLAGFIAALKLEKPLVMGYSDGGIIALNFLLRHPGVARAAVVAGASHKIAADEHYAAGMMAFYGYNQPGELPDPVLDRWVKDFPQYVELYQKLHGTPNKPDRWRELYKRVWPTWTTPWIMDSAALGKIETPVLVLLAQHDEFFTPEQNAELARLIPKAELAILPGVGHLGYRQKAAIFNAITIDFLSRQ
jgi:pimeloyl-ACP methyl ester carboxylesterase